MQLNKRDASAFCHLVTCIHMRRRPAHFLHSPASWILLPDLRVSSTLRDHNAIPRILQANKWDKDRSLPRVNEARQPKRFALLSACTRQRPGLCQMSRTARCTKSRINVFSEAKHQSRAAYHIRCRKFSATGVHAWVTNLASRLRH